MTSRARLHELDGLRALAAISVLVAHFNFDGLPNGESVVAIVTWTHRHMLANHAVSFFYVLSAFLLTTLAIREIRESGSFSRQNFLLRRVARIWPLYWCMMGFTVIIALGPLASYGASPESWPWLRDHFLLYAAFLGNWSLAFAIPGFHVDRSLPGLAVLWSIAVEEQFYLLYAALAATVLISGRRVALTVVLAVLVGMTYRWWHITYIHPMQQLTGVYYATLSYLDMFALGAAVAWLIAGTTALGKYARAFFRSPLALVPILGLFTGTLDSWAKTPWGPAFAPVFMYSMTAIAMSFLVGWCVVNNDRWIVRLAFATWPLRMLGLLSYGIYVWHPIARSMVANWLPPMDANATFFWYLVATILSAIVTYAIVERPFIMLARRWRRYGTPVTNSQSASGSRTQDERLDPDRSLDINAGRLS